jgi:Ser-tRNA(Ala) deacylase AlaX
MSDNELKSKRIILNPKKPTISRSAISLYSPVQQILADALDTVANETLKLNLKSRSGKLDASDAKMLQGYIKSLVDISKELREVDKQSDVENMSDEELKALAQEFLKKDSK